jgi:hypothetical protein
MAGLLDIFGTGGQDVLGLLGGNVGQARDDAQAQALYALAGSLLSGGPTGLSIVKGLQQGQQAYKQAMRGELEDRMTQFQLQEYAKKKQEEEAAKKREALAQQLMIKAYQPAQTEVTTETPMFDLQGNQLMGPNMPQAARPSGYNKDVVNQMLAFKEGQAALGNMAKIIPELRKAGIFQGAQQDNPFLMFTQDETIPANIRSLAGQYSKSYSSGLIDPEKVDERVRQLSEMTQRVQQFQQTQAGLQEQRAATNALAQGNQQIQRMIAEAKLEEKQAKATEKANTKSEAKDQLTATVEQLKGKYDTLLQEGGIVSTQAGGLQNIGARLSSSGVGRAIGGAVGTKTQEQRQAIEQTRPLLLNLIKNATGMSAQQMNSNAEMQLYLNAATNPDLSYEANMEALKNLDRLFGLGTAAEKIEKSVTAPQRPGQSRSGW